MADFTDKDILNYLNLAQRRTYIILHSGIDWKPEYAFELVEIDRQLAAYRQCIDEIHSQEVV